MMLHASSSTVRIAQVYYNSAMREELLLDIGVFVLFFHFYTFFRLFLKRLIFSFSAAEPRLSGRRTAVRETPTEVGNCAPCNNTDAHDSKFAKHGHIFSTDHLARSNLSSR